MNTYRNRNIWTIELHQPELVNVNDTIHGYVIAMVNKRFQAAARLKSDDLCRTVNIQETFFSFTTKGYL